MRVTSRFPRYSRVTILAESCRLITPLPPFFLTPICASASEADQFFITIFSFSGLMPCRLSARPHAERSEGGLTVLEGGATGNGVF